MKDLLRISVPTGARFELALEQLLNGMGFVFGEVWFRRDDKTLMCEAISPYSRPKLSNSEISELTDRAKDRFHDLFDSSEAFRKAVADLHPQFSAICDYGTGTLPITQDR